MTIPGLSEDEVKQLQALVAKMDVPAEEISKFMEANGVGAVAFEGGISFVEALCLAKAAHDAKD